MKLPILAGLALALTLALTIGATRNEGAPPLAETTPPLTSTEADPSVTDPETGSIGTAYWAVCGKGVCTEFEADDRGLVSINDRRVEWWWNQARKAERRVKTLEHRLARLLTPPVDESQPVWERAVEVHRFFFNRPLLARTLEATRTLRQHARAAYNALIGKWERVHLCEGSWTANTGNGYYGGLQMDMSFQRSYGGEFMVWWGTANVWPAWAQMTAAERAYQTRGFSPWPVCGA